MCRSSSEYAGNNDNAACLIRTDDHLLLIRHRLSGKLDLPGGGKREGETLACAAHRETWEETGLNVMVSDVLGTTANGLVIFHCQEQANLAVLPDEFSPPDWASLEVTSLHKVNPFELDHDALRFADDLVPLRDSFVAIESAAVAPQMQSEDAKAKGL